MVLQVRSGKCGTGQETQVQRLLLQVRPLPCENCGNFNCTPLKARVGAWDEALPPTNSEKASNACLCRDQVLLKINRPPMRILRLASGLTSVTTSAADVAIRLKFISRINVGETLSVAGMSTQHDTWWTTLQRTLSNRDSRRETYRFFSSTVESAFEILRLNARSQCKEDQELCFKLVEELVRAANGGIKHSMTTYEYDAKFCCDLEVLRDETLRRVKSYQPRSEEHVDSDDDAPLP